MVLSVVTIAGVNVASSGTDDPTERQPTEAETPSGDVDLADADTRLLGEGANDTAGWTVASAGDVNGDGNDDLLVGTPGNDSAGNDSGAAYVFYGPVDTGDVSLSAADVKLAGVGAGDLASIDVAGGDLDGDGYSDLVVGAPFNDSAGSNAGTVYVVYGSSELSGTISLADADVTLRGGAAGDQAGRSVATVNGSDGIHDLVVGAPYADAAGNDSGAAYVFDGSGLAPGSLADGATFTGAGAGDLASSAVSSAGDFDGDGVDDLLVGARLNDTGGEDAGAAYVVAGANRFDGGSLASATMELVGAGAGDNAGYAVSDAGDVNDDGVDDVIVGAPLNDSAGANAGAAYVVYGSASPASSVPLADAALTLRGMAAGDRAGWAVSSAGSMDENCDSFDDVLVGAPYNNSTGPNAGAAYLVYGGHDGSLSLADADATFSGVSEGDRAGWSVAAAEDATGDGEDVLIGAPYNDSVGNDAGAAYLFEGPCPEERETPTKTPARTESPTPSPGDTPTATATPKSSPTPTPDETTGTAEYLDCHSVRIEGRAESVVAFGTRITPEDPDADGVVDGFSTNGFTDVLGELDGTRTEEYDESFQLNTVFFYDRPVEGANQLMYPDEVVQEFGEPAVRIDNPRFEQCLQEFRDQYETETPAPTPTPTESPTPTRTPTPTATATPTTTTENVEVSVAFLDCRSAKVDAPEGYLVRYFGFTFVETGEGAAHPNWLDPISEDEWSGGEGVLSTDRFYPDNPEKADRTVLTSVAVYNPDYERVAGASNPDAENAGDVCGREAECEAAKQGIDGADPDACEGDVAAMSAPTATETTTKGITTGATTNEPTETTPATTTTKPTTGSTATTQTTAGTTADER